MLRLLVCYHTWPALAFYPVLEFKLGSDSENIFQMKMKAVSSALDLLMAVADQGLGCVLRNDQKFRLGSISVLSISPH